MQRLHEGVPAVVPAGTALDCLAELCARELARPRAHVAAHALAPQIDQRLGRVDAAAADERREELFDGLRLGLGGARQTERHRAGDSRILLQDLGLEEGVGARDRVVGRDGDARRERSGCTAPLGRRQRRREVAHDRVAEVAHALGKQPARGRDVAPDERFAIGQEPTPRRLHGLRLEDAQAAVVALRRPSRGLARCALEQARGEPPRRERADRRKRQPLALDVTPRHERERERVGARARSERQVQRQCDARAHRRSGERAPRAERDLGSEGDERRRVTLVEPP